ncbi:hypothetical protein E3T23_01010 [Cryobacterium cheniae]|uniref:ATP/GTP-binding protein n=1 Tax=Cryobacterium cheniae TaxID=1259262 RepID=A0A4R8XYG7_9MICO|nr:hypothetical protein [Cryobacterium cheniae]TFC83873.1 hypothetical protein E3T23_01010 [Cryobacterium cheniae]
MARSNRPRGRKPGPGSEDDGLERMRAGWRRTETRRDGLWTVQPVPGPQALKSYVCPGCHREVAPGTAHVVAWRGDGVMGEASDLAARRHWHSHCWKIK